LGAGGDEEAATAAAAARPSRLHALLFSLPRLLRLSPEVCLLNNLQRVAKAWLDMTRGYRQDHKRCALGPARFGATGVPPPLPSKPACTSLT